MKYRTIVADPPWDHSDGTGAVISQGFGRTRRLLPGPARATVLPYPTMTLGEICTLPVADLAGPDAHLYLWVTNRYLRDVWSVAEAWGFRGVSVQTWCKQPLGFRTGGTFPSNTEFFLFARRGKLSTASYADGRWFQWPRRRGPAVGLGQKRQSMHSAKPEHFYDLVEQVSPPPYVELFSRRQRLGWDVWGNESANTAQLGEPA